MKSLFSINKIYLTEAILLILDVKLTYLLLDYYIAYKEKPTLADKRYYLNLSNHLTDSANNFRI